MAPPESDGRRPAQAYKEKGDGGAQRGGEGGEEVKRRAALRRGALRRKLHVHASRPLTDDDDGGDGDGDDDGLLAKAVFGEPPCPATAPWLPPTALFCKA
uniref:Uncharacterized protein n=1 Tax=Ananas comosus var. bracteatus TaxID=296719 RepID=A0A6V7PRT3_ANACO|nr:unnamed protein product [Ananas comosus var. bracteatus]